MVLGAIEKKKGNKLPEVAPVNAKDWFPIPEHYSDLEKSSLSFTLDQENRTFNIDLKMPAPNP